MSIRSRTVHTGVRMWRRALVLVAFGASLGTPVRAELPPLFALQWGSFGSAPGQFVHPTGIDVDASGNVYVADWGNDRIQKFDPNGTLIAVWGARGSARGEFVGPRDVAVDRSRGFVHVSDAGNWRIQTMTTSGVYDTSWTMDIGHATVSYLAVRPSDGEVNGTFRTSVYSYRKGGPFLGSKQAVPFDPEGPHYLGLAFDASNRVFVADFGADRIVRFSPSSVNPDREWPVIRPRGVAVGSGVLVVADDRLLKFTQAGVLLWSLGRQGEGAGEFLGAVDVASAPSGAIYVLDQGNERVQKFVP